MPARGRLKVGRTFDISWRQWLVVLSATWLALVVWPPLRRLTGAPPEADRALEIRLRVEWGHGQPRKWNGVLRVTGGRVSRLTVLGWSADAPGCVLLHEDEVRVSQRRPREYDGFDVTVTAAPEARLLLEFAPNDQPSERRYLEIPLRELIPVDGLHDSPLDNQNNRLVIRRTQGDRLRLKVGRQPLVFSTGEYLELGVTAYQPGFRLDAESYLQLKLRRARQGDEIWDRQSKISELRGDHTASFPPIRFEVPDREGVYQLELEFYRSRNRLVVPLVGDTPDLTRQLQFVVIGTQSPVTEKSDFETILTLDPTGTSWWDQFARLAQMEWLASARAGVTGDGKTSRVKHLGKEWVELPPAGWQLYPLTVASVGAPHVLEVDFPDVTAQSLGISILEPNVLGQVGPLGLDSGVEVDRQRTDSPGAVRTHRLLFWPKTSTPMVLLTNRRSQDPALFGTIRVRRGPSRLPPRGDPRVRSDGAAPARVLAAFFERPLFPENFQASQTGIIDTAPLDDWVTFYEGSRRLTQYLRYAGYNAAVLSVNCEGSSLYPSDKTVPTPKYDSGVLLGTAADPRRKDVLEMLFRLFNREGLRLIPAIEFASLLPELERMRLDANLASGQLDGMDMVRRDGKPWSEVHTPRGGLAPHYNPLDPRVQRAMRGVVKELVDRYAHHPAFAGVALQLGAETFAQFPDENWGWDRVTRERFARASGVDLIPDTPGTVITDAERSLWLNWRASQLGTFYKSLRATIGHRRENGRLYLLGARMLDYRRLQRELRPALARRGRRPLAMDKANADPAPGAPMKPADRIIREVMLRVGIDSDTFRDDAQVVLLRPHRLAFQAPVNERAVDLRLQHSAAFSRYFANAGSTGTLLFHKATPLSLPTLDERSPFGKENTHSWLLAHFSPGGTANRRRFVHALATLEADTLIAGGWMLPMGQEDALLPFFSTFRRLPARRFRDVLPQAEMTSNQPVIVRTLVEQGQTLVYLLNDSAWPVEAHLEFQIQRDCRIQSLGPQRIRPLVLRGSRATWSASLDAYDLVAVSLSAEDVKVLGWTVSYADEVTATLQEQLQDLQKRVRMARERYPTAGLANGGFERASEAGRPTGWMHAPVVPGGDLGVELDSQQSHSGERSLHLQHAGRSRRSRILWVRSRPLERPLLDRLTLAVWARIPAAAAQPPLRLAIEGQVNDQSYYRYAWVGANVNNERFKLESRWKLFHVPFDHLPLDGLTDLRIGFDLMGPGEVWIDEVQILDTWFSQTELGQLEKDLALARFQLEQGRVSDCQGVLDSYWPRFFRSYVPLVPALRPARQPAGDEVGSRPAATTAERPSSPWYRRWLPRF